MISEPSNFLLYKGWVSVKKGLMSVKRFAALCAPETVDDIQAIYEFLFVSETETPVPLDGKSIAWLGSIAYSAVKVLLESDTKTDKPTFVHLDALTGISDEVTMRSACSFTLHFQQSDIKINCATSVDYQDWMQALGIAYQRSLHHHVNARKTASPIGLESAIPMLSSAPRRERYSNPLLSGYPDMNSAGSNVSRQPRLMSSPSENSFGSDKASLTKSVANR